VFHVSVEVYKAWKIKGKIRLDIKKQWEEGERPGKIRELQEST
jgi:hypothetical protein